MENQIDETLDSSPAEVAPEMETVSEDVKTPTASDKPEAKTVPYERFKEVNDELARLKKEPVKVINKSLDVGDYIDISASLEGLDQREKERLAYEHKLTGRSLNELRQDEDFLLWQSAHRAKVEKEKLALKPTGTQAESDAPKSFSQKLAGASMADKEKILTEAGLYRSPRPRVDRVNLGRGK